MEPTDSDFEDSLKLKGEDLKEFNPCPHFKAELGNYILYCLYEKWEKSPYCSDCLWMALESHFCGGNYTNSRCYKIIGAYSTRLVQSGLFSKLL